MFIRKYKLLFIHIPKAGGTTIEQGLRVYSLARASERDLLMGKNIWPWLGPPRMDHLTLSEAYAHLPRSLDRTKIVSFAITRSPYSRLVSEYNWRGVSWKYRLRDKHPWSFRSFVLRYFPTKWDDNYFKGFDNFRHVMPQTKFTHSKTGEQLVTATFDISEIDTKCAAWLKNLGLHQWRSGRRYNRSQSRHPSTGELQKAVIPIGDYYDEETIYFVRQYYHDDFEAFGYDIDSI